MSENPNPPLPRFEDSLKRLRAGRNKVSSTKTMTLSMSMPNLKSRSEKPKKVERTPQRKERERKYIDISPVVVPTHKQESFNQVSKTKTEIIDTRNDDLIQNEGDLAVTLPLVQSSKPPQISDIFDNSQGEKVMLVQLPSALPIQYPNDSIQMEYNPLFSAADGHIGKLYVHQSGKVTAKIGSIVLDVSSGISPSCSTLMCVKREKGIDYFTIPGQKLKFSVDINHLLESK